MKLQMRTGSLIVSFRLTVQYHYQLIQLFTLRASELTPRPRPLKGYVLHGRGRMLGGP